MENPTNGKIRENGNQFAGTTQVEPTNYTIHQQVAKKIRLTGNQFVETTKVVPTNYKFYLCKFNLSEQH